jgi:hypothetical protein
MVRKTKFSCGRRFTSSLICHRSITGRGVGYWAPYRFVGRNGSLNAGSFIVNAKSDVLEVPFGNYLIYNKTLTVVNYFLKNKIIFSGSTHKPYLR